LKKIHAEKSRSDYECRHCGSTLVKTICGLSLSKNSQNVSNFMPDIDCNKCLDSINSARIKAYKESRREEFS
jgi:hypothetical protein